MHWHITKAMKIPTIKFRTAGNNITTAATMKLVVTNKKYH